MKVTRILSAILFLAVAGSFFVAHSLAADSVQNKTLDGYLVDVSCATDNAANPDKNFRPAHTKDCMLMEDCAGSGFALLTADDKIIKFDDKSSLPGALSRDRKKIKTSRSASRENYKATN